MDEHRIGLKPLLGRVWAPQGQRPRPRVAHRYQWLYLYGFVRPTSGQTFWLLLPSVSVAAYSQALSVFAQAVGAGAAKRIVLVDDNAGWHRSSKLVVPDGIERVPLPPYSPELQPAERLWPLTNQALLNKHFDDLDAVMERQAERCRLLQQQPETIRSRTNFHWWPQNG